jgi:hypothetical protein
MRSSIRAVCTAVSALALAGAATTASATAVTTPPAPVRTQTQTEQPKPTSPGTPNINLRPSGTEKSHAGALAPDASLDLVDHGGQIMPSSTTFSIFWLPPGHNTVSANYISLMNRYLSDVGGTPHYNILTQYPGSNGATTNSSTFGGTWTDTAAFPAGHDGSSQANAVTDADIRAEITRAIAQNPSWGPASITRMYFVFTGAGVITCKGTNDCSGTQYCAYHNFFDGDTIYGSMPYDGDTLNGCYAGGPSPNNDDAAEAELSSLEHEHFEAVNDPHLNAWFNASGDEIGDICNRDMGSRDASGANIYLNGHPYVIQREYSNADHACVKSTGPVPVINVAGSLQFGTVARGQSATRTVTVSNTGNAVLKVLNVSLTGDPAFTLQTPGTPRDIAPGASASYDVRFSTPLNTPVGPRSANLRITNNAIEDGIHNVAANANVGKAASTIVYTGATTADFHDPFTASSTLTAGGSPLGGATVTFSLGTGLPGETCGAVTDSAGAASCSLTPQEKAGPSTITAGFAGDVSTEPSSASAAFTITREETSLAYTGPARIANGEPTHLSSVLKEDGVSPISGRTVTIVIGTGSGAQSCSGVTDAAGTAACTIAVVNQDLNAAATVPLHASFAGDDFYLPSAADATLKLQFATGRAFGASSAIHLPLLPIIIPPRPDTGQVRTARAISTNTPCTASISTLVLTVNALCANVTTTLAPETSTATSTVANARIGVPGLPLIEVSAVKATSVSTCTGTSGTATVTLRIAGQLITVPAAPNTVIDLGVGKLILNEQLPVPGADFGLTVNAVHLIALGGTVDVVLASSTSDMHNCV